MNKQELLKDIETGAANCLNMLNRTQQLCKDTNCDLAYSEQDNLIKDLVTDIRNLKVQNGGKKRKSKRKSRKRKRKSKGKRKK